MYAFKNYLLNTKTELSLGRNSESVCGSVAQSCPTLCNPMNYIAHQSPLSVEFSTQEYWKKLPFPSPGVLPNPEIKPTTFVSLALAGGFFTTSAIWKVHSQSVTICQALY